MGNTSLGMDSTTAPFGLKKANTRFISIILLQQKQLWPYSSYWICLVFMSHL